MYQETKNTPGQMIFCEATFSFEELYTLLDKTERATPDSGTYLKTAKTHTNTNLQDILGIPLIEEYSNSR